MKLFIWYYERPFGWLEKIRSDDDLYEMCAVSTTNVIIDASQNTLRVEDKHFWYTDTETGRHVPPKNYCYDWFTYDFLSGKHAQEEKLINWLFRLGWRTIFVDSDLFLDWRNRSVPLGKLNRIALEHLRMKEQERNYERRVHHT